MFFHNPCLVVACFAAFRGFFLFISIFFLFPSESIGAVALFSLVRQPRPRVQRLILTSKRRRFPPKRYNARRAGCAGRGVLSFAAPEQKTFRRSGAGSEGAPAFSEEERKRGKSDKGSKEQDERQGINAGFNRLCLIEFSDQFPEAVDVV